MMEATDATLRRRRNHAQVQMRNSRKRPRLAERSDDDDHHGSKPERNKSTTREATATTTSASTSRPPLPPTVTPSIRPTGLASSGVPSSSRPTLPPILPTISSQSSTARTSTVNVQDLVSSLLGAGLTGVTTLSLPNGASPTVPAVASLQSADRVVRPEAEEREHSESGDNHIIVVVASPQNKPQKSLGKGAIAGIVIGVLAFVGLVAAAILVWRKYRRDGKLPFMRATRHRLADDESRGPSIGGPLPVRVGERPPVKTNTQIMDDLMQAAYAAEGGGGGGGANDMEEGFALGNKPSPPPPPPPVQPKGPYMDEKAYAALVGPPSPGSPKKPVMRWLDGVRPPTQPNGPEFPPTPDMPASATMPRLPGRDSRYSGQLRRPEAAFSDGSSVTMDWRQR